MVDAYNILELLQEFHEAEWPHVPLALDKVVPVVHECLTTGAVFIVEIDGEMAGSMGLCPRSWWFSDTYFLGDYWTYVRPQYRKSRAAALLLEKAKHFARVAGLRLIVSVFSRQQIKRKNALYRRHFSPMGEIFIDPGDDAPGGKTNG